MEFRCIQTTAQPTITAVRLDRKATRNQQLHIVPNVTGKLLKVHCHQPNLIHNNVKKAYFYFILTTLTAIHFNSNAQYSILHSFECGGGMGYDNFNSDVGFVSDGLFLYGIAKYGGINNTAGAVIKMNLDSTNITYLHEFLNDSIGYRPYGSLLLSNDTLYGIITNGGQYGMGAIFRLKTDGTAFSKIFDFENETTGRRPESPLILCDNVIYGKTQGGGSPSASCIYKINKDGTGFSKVRNFTTPADALTGNITIKDDYLYGMTKNTIFKLSITDTTYQLLYSQSNLQPKGIILTDSLIYCVTKNGGLNGLGNIFKMNYDGSDYFSIFDFSGLPNGYNPSGNLCLNNNIFYGLASSGGKYGNGVIYEVNINGTKYDELFDFYTGQDITGGCPTGYLFYSDSALYGLTYLRTIFCYGGNVFKYKTNKQFQTSNIEFNNISTSSVDISWTNGNGMKRVVYIKKGTGTIFPPMDFYEPYGDIPIGIMDTTYSYRIYNDTGSFVQLNNLQADTIFTVRAFEYSYIKNGQFPVYNSLDTINNPATFMTLIVNVNKPNIHHDSFTVFPNPVKDHLNIQFSKNIDVYKIEIFNESGQVLFAENGNVINNNLQIEINDFPPGIYFVKIQSKDQILIEKILKK